MALSFRCMKRHYGCSSLLYWLPAVLFCLVSRTAGLTLREVARQKHMVLAVATHKSAADGDNTNTADAGGPKDQEGWLCRISKGFAACGNREYNGIYPPAYGTYCPERFCCSKTACLGGCGSWCHDSWALCSSSVVFHPEWSYGNCNCKRFGHQCDDNAECVHLNEDNGGAYCQCRFGFMGNGKTCARDFCAGNPCTPGECKRLEDGYSCTCPDTHMVKLVNQKETCTEKPDFCFTNPCGPAFMVKSCTNTETDYVCECQEGYTARNKRCEEVDLCDSDPCGPPEGVHSCETLRTPTFTYSCECKTGYDLRLLPDNKHETCKKNWCYGNPCGDEARALSCHSSDEGYSCLCRDTYVVQKNEEGREECVKDDVCKNSPCGTPDKAKRCYAEGSGYRCDCQPGFVELGVGGRKVCVEGDPCSLEVCGSQEMVEECTTNGSNYTCKCREPDYMLGTRDGEKACLSKQGCINNCGPLDAVKSCAIHKGAYSCTCNPGYMTSYRDGKKMCVHQDVCAVAPCGPENAAEKCTPTGSNSPPRYTCVCKEGYEVRTLEDQSEVCAETGSCVGNPCGSPEAVKACITENRTYSCHCAEGYVQVALGGGPRCVHSDDTSSSQRVGAASSGTTSPSGMSNLALAGYVGGGLLLLGCVGAGVVYARRREDEGEEGERQPIAAAPEAAAAADVFVGPAPPPYAGSPLAR